MFGRWAEDPRNCRKIRTGHRFSAPCRICGRRDDVRLSADGYDVGGVPATRPFAVVGVDGAVLERGDGALEAARLVQGVRVDGDLSPAKPKRKDAAANSRE